MNCPKPKLVVSGRQTGVDRAALDWAIEMGITQGGWYPRGRTAQHGPLADHYELKETPSFGYSQSTRLNLNDSDAALIIHRGMLEGSSRLSQRFTRHMQKPIELIRLNENWHPQIDRFHQRWIALNAFSLNVTGPSEERSLGIYELSMTLMEQIWKSQ